MARSVPNAFRLGLALAAAGSAAAVAAAAPAVDPQFRAAFTGTIVSTYPDGRTARLWLSPDGTYRASGRKKDPSSGHWRIKGDKVCLKQARPFPAPFSFCTPKPAAEEWKAKAFTGEPITVRLVPGGRPG